MAPGTHRFEVDLPEESVASVVNVTLKERDRPYLLELKPAYGSRVAGGPVFSMAFAGSILAGM